MQGCVECRGVMILVGARARLHKCLKCLFFVSCRKGTHINCQVGGRSISEES